MKTHTHIVATIGAEKLAATRKVSVNTVRAWARRNSIPAEHWQALAQLGLVTLEDLAAAAASQRSKRNGDEGEAGLICMHEHEDAGGCGATSFEDAENIPAAATVT